MWADDLFPLYAILNTLTAREGATAGGVAAPPWIAGREPTAAAILQDCLRPQRDCREGRGLDPRPRPKRHKMAVEPDLDRDRDDQGPPPDRGHEGRRSATELGRSPPTAAASADGRRPGRSRDCRCRAGQLRARLPVARLPGRRADDRDDRTAVGLIPTHGRDGAWRGAGHQTIARKGRGGAPRPRPR